MTLSLYFLLSHGLDFKRQVVHLLILDDDLHPLSCIMVSQSLDVGIAKAYAPLAGPSRHAFGIVGASMYSYSAVPWGHQSEEEVSVCLDAASPVLEVMHPRGCVLNLRNVECVGERVPIEAVA